MNFFTSIPSAYYATIFTVLTTLLALATIVRYAGSNSNTALVQEYKIPIMPLALCLVLALFIGMRDPYSGYFVDTYMYTHSYNNIIAGAQEANLETEWLWNNIAVFCQSLKLDVTGYYVVIAMMYYGFTFAACHRLMRNNVWIAFLFCITSFSFYTYGINGIRSGLACSMLTYAIALMADKKKLLIGLGIALGLLCTGIHRSTALPLLCAIVALTAIKEPKIAIYFWLASVVISLIAGNAIGDLFAAMGFDDRTRYFQDASLNEGADQFSSTGFRFDFLIYSAMPLLMTWYVTMKRSFNDRTFNIIAVTYILANAFWIMVIRAEYSNRFAYLSWFLYPIVIAYPLLRFRLWQDQDRKTAIILALYAGFTFFMNFIYYA